MNEPTEQDFLDFLEAVQAPGNPKHVPLNPAWLPLPEETEEVWAERIGPAAVHILSSLVEDDA